MNKHKIIKTWKSSNERFMLGYDKAGNIFAKCINCGETCVGTLSIDKKKKSVIFVCPKCGDRIKVNYGLKNQKIYI